jgi:DNA polymerase-3 subunit alpha/error-prone DNA polymerase
MASLLGVRSCWSLLYGTAAVGAIVEQAARWGCRALAVSDRENLYGVHEFIEAAKEAGIRPIIAVEFLYRQAGLPSPSLFAFAIDRHGFSRLCTLVSSARTDSSFNIVTALSAGNAGLVVACGDAGTLEKLRVAVKHLYAAITPRSLGAIPYARQHGLPLVVLEDSTFLSKDEMPVHAVLRAIALGKTVGTLADGDCEHPDAFLRSPAELESMFSSWPQALQGSEEIADMCRFDTVFDGFVFPSYGGCDAQAQLRSRVVDGAERRYGELSDGIMERIGYELDIIGRKGFAPYFLVMDDIVAMASRTCGRGSGAASIVSYALGITNVDPIAHNLYFERFLTIARPDPPDIDVDFAWDERDALLKRVIERFGPERCARVANHNRFRARCALRETAKAYGLPDAAISSAERAFFQRNDSQAPLDPLWAEVIRMAKRIEGLPRGLSMHCGGLVITPEDTRLLAPVERSADGYPLLGWEKEGTEAAGLVKIDLLGNRSLAVIRDALANLAEQGVVIDADTWHPAEDQATIDALARGDSMGVFYIESPAMRQLQKKTGKGDFDHIVIHSSIIRPAANKYIAEYVRRLKGAPWDPLHPRLAYILDETYGILCYQEDVSKTAVALAGFSEADADKLRKVIAKKAGAVKLGEYAERFACGCLANGVDRHTIDEVWAMMLSFDGYSFCKPHSASYAMVSFQSAYLRVHHPACFMAAVLSNQGGYYRPQAYISESRRMGLAVQGPDINRSRYRYHAEGSSVIVGLMAIARVGHGAVSSILSERTAGGPFTSLEEFARRVPLQRDDVVALVAAGAFDSIAPTLARSCQARTLLTRLQSGRTESAMPLFQEQGPQPLFRAVREKAVAVRTASDSELHEEYDSLGFLRDHHPLLLWKARIARIRRVRACDIAAWEGRRVTLLGWPVTQKEVWTKDGARMDFVSFEDETALYEAVLFPQTFERFRHLLFSQHPLIVKGSVQNDQGALSVEVSQIAVLP